MNKRRDSDHKNTKKDNNKQEVKKITRTKELGGPAGLEPTRYGDWERKGRCIDF